MVVVEMSGVWVMFCSMGLRAGWGVSNALVGDG